MTTTTTMMMNLNNVQRHRFDTRFCILRNIMSCNRSTSVLLMHNRLLETVPLRTGSSLCNWFNKILTHILNLAAVYLSILSYS